MAAKIEHVNWPDAPKGWMPYAPAIKGTGGAMVFIAGVTAAPVYHSHPHVPAEFANMPTDMEGQAIATLENLKKSLDAVGVTFANVVVANRYLTDLSQQDILNKVWNKYVGENKPTTTTVQVVRLATDPRCLVEISAIAVV
jgi:enamine deaminase RidA (YjgF/YER057c/UK114 family)